MKFKRGKFYIAIKEKESKQATFIIKEGWIDTSEKFGFHKKANGWCGIDLESGTAICWRKTRKACVEFIEENAERILHAKQEEHYKTFLKIKDNWMKENNIK